MLRRRVTGRLGGAYQQTEGGARPKHISLHRCHAEPRQQPNSGNTTSHKMMMNAVKEEVMLTLRACVRHDSGLFLFEREHVLGMSRIRFNYGTTATP